MRDYLRTNRAQLEEIAADMGPYPPTTADLQKRQARGLPQLRGVERKVDSIFSEQLQPRISALRRSNQIAPSSRRAGAG